MNKKAKHLLIKTRRNIFGELSGNNASLKGGDGFDFFELRPYMYGEDVRRIDWKRSAKMGTPYVKLFHEEREIQILIVPILSGSLHFGLERLKQDVLAEIVAILGFSAIKNGDRFSILECRGEGVQIGKLSKQSAILQDTINRLIEEKLLGVYTEYEKVVEVIMKRFKRRSFVVFVGDFWKVPNFSILSKKHEVLALVVRDRFEERPKALGNLMQIDPNTMQRTNIVLDRQSIKARIKEIKEYDSKLFASFLKQRIRATKIYTDENVFARMSLFLGK